MAEKDEFSSGQGGYRVRLFSDFATARTSEIDIAEIESEAPAEHANTMHGSWYHVDSLALEAVRATSAQHGTCTPHLSTDGISNNN